MTTTERHRRADQILDAALDLPEERRAAFLDRECGDDAELRALVSRLLRYSSDEATTDSLVTGAGMRALPSGFGEAVADLAGTTLGRYRILREIGRGGMGVVYEGLDTTLDRTVAVKVLPALAFEPGGRERFLREARTAAALHHPSIVAIFDADEADGRRYLVMEHVAGASLADEPPRDLVEAVEIARQVCDALEHAHARGVVHRDLKPGNILVTRGKHGRPAAKLTDLGIALSAGRARVTRTGTITGTPTYMAPEQALGHQVDGRADLYSLGVLLYLWAAGRPPFHGDDVLTVVSQHIHAPVVPPSTHNPDMPAGLEPIILKLLAKDPECRYPSAAVLRDALVLVGTGPAAAGVTDPGAIAGLTRGRLVGRQGELARLQALWRASASGACHLALLSGEPGVGKTRLATEVMATAALERAAVLAGGCYEYEATTPYLPFLEAFRKVVRRRDDDDLRRVLGDSAAEIARLAPEVESRLGPLPRRPTLSPQEERLRLFDHVARFLARLSEPAGLLVFLDDLHWADHGTLGLLRYLLRHLGDRRILFLAAYREVEVGRSHPLAKALVDWDRTRAATRVKVERLDLATTGRMLATLLDQEEVPDDLVARLHAETEGNPFFVEEVVKALIADGGLVRKGSRWQVQTTDRLVLPQSVKAAVGGRLARLSDRGNDVLSTAAVLGKQFAFAELASVSDASEDELLDALDEACSAQLVAAGRGESFAFTHDKIREVLYDELNPVRRRRIHARVAAGLQRMLEDGADVAVEELAHHFVASGDAAMGRRWALEAADAARRVYAWDEALEMLARARECTEELELADELPHVDRSMGDVAWARGDITASAEHYERALQGADDPTLQDQIRAQLAEVYVTSGDPRGLEHARLALDRVDPTREPRAAAQALMVRARYHHLHGELERAAELYPRAIELAEPLGDPAFLTRALAFLSGTYQHLADFERSDAAAGRCLTIGEEHQLPDGIMFGCEFLAENCILRGEWQRSVDYMQREEALAREVHAGERYVWSHYRAEALHGLGRLEDAEEVARRGIAEGRQLGETRLELFLVLVLGLCHADRGSPEKGLELAHEVLRQADEARLISHRIQARGTLVRILLQTGRHAEAGRVADEAVGLWRQSGSRGVGLSLGPDLAEGLLAGGDAAAATDVLDRHLSIARDTGSRARIAQNLRVRGLVAAAAGRTGEALEALDRATDELEATDTRLDLVRALTARASLHRRSGLRDEADADLERAERIARSCGASPGALTRSPDSGRSR